MRLAGFLLCAASGQFVAGLAIYAALDEFPVKTAIGFWVTLIAAFIVVNVEFIKEDRKERKRKAGRKWWND